MPNPKTIEALQNAIGKKITNVDFSDDGTCIVLLFEDEPTPMTLNIFSSKEISVESNGGE